MIYYLNFYCSIQVRLFSSMVIASIIKKWRWFLQFSAMLFTVIKLVWQHQSYTLFVCVLVYFCVCVSIFFVCFFVCLLFGRVGIVSHLIHLTWIKIWVGERRKFWTRNKFSLFPDYTSNAVSFTLIPHAFANYSDYLITLYILMIKAM